MLITLQKVGKGFGADWILRNITAGIDKQDRIGMIGENGTGKTTLLRIITGELLPDPPMEERMAVMVSQAELMASYQEERAAFLEARKHCGWYMTGLRGAAALRRQAGTISSLEDVRALAQAALELWAAQQNNCEEANRL